MALYKVIIDRKDSGIIESNYAFASKYWKYRSRVLGVKIVLKKID